MAYRLTLGDDPGLGALDPSRRIGDVVLPFEDAVIAREMIRMDQLRRIQTQMLLGGMLREMQDEDED